MNAARLLRSAAWFALATVSLAAAPRPAAAQTVYTADLGDTTVGKYNANGTAINAAFLSSANGLSVPSALALAGNTLYVGNSPAGDSYINAFDATTGAAASGFTNVNLNGSLQDVAVGGGMLYASVAGTNTVTAYNAATGMAATGFTTITATNPLGLALSGSTLFVSYYTGTVATYNATTGTVINSSFLSGLSRPDFLAVAGGAIYVSDHGNNNVRAFNLATGAALPGFTTISDTNDPEGIKVFNNILYVNDTNANQVGEYNATTGAVINAAAIPGPNRPIGLAVTAPEPGTWTLLALGAGGLGLVAYRRRAA